MKRLSVMFDPDLIQCVKFNLPTMIIDSMAYDKDNIILKQHFVRQILDPHFGILYNITFLLFIIYVLLLAKASRLYSRL